MNPTELHELIRKRRTEKVLGEVSAPCVVPPEVAAKNNPLVLAALETAGMAPFHYPRGKEIAEPWRAHVLWNAETIALASYLQKDLGVKTKEPLLAAACSSLVLITWMPEFPEAEDEKKKTIDEEHLAAASAMTQNFLLLLTSYGFGNYWSSGGILRTKPVLSHLGVPKEEKLLGAIFIEYPETANPDLERKPGTHREKRSNKWISQIAGF